MKSINVERTTFNIKFVDPYEIIQNLNIAQGITAVDFGCGAGHFSLALARKIGETGLVYAFDILPEKVGAVASDARGRGFSNVITKRANLEKANGSRLEDSSVDLVIIKNMLFQNLNKSVILAEASRILKKKGMALVIEWNMNNEMIGPKRQMRISKEALLLIAQSAGLNILKEIPAGSFHSGWIFAKYMY